MLVTIGKIFAICYIVGLLGFLALELKHRWDHRESDLPMDRPAKLVIDVLLWPVFIGYKLQVVAKTTWFAYKQGLLFSRRY